jgi:hypothetical protein
MLPKSLNDLAVPLEKMRIEGISVSVWKRPSYLLTIDRKLELRTVREAKTPSMASQKFV